MTYRDDPLYLSEMRDSGRAGGPQALGPDGPCGVLLSWGETCELPKGHPDSHGIPLPPVPFAASALAKRRRRR